MDDGLGISKDQHERIFEMFFRGSERSIGSGLGLYLVKKAIEKLGGTIKLSSQPKKYTSFNIFLPSIEFEMEEDLFEK
jgi:signal transduction histidine kinase